MSGFREQAAGGLGAIVGRWWARGGTGERGGGAKDADGWCIRRAPVKDRIDGGQNLDLAVPLAPPALPFAVVRGGWPVVGQALAQREPSQASARGEPGRKGEGADGPAVNGPG